MSESLLSRLARPTGIPVRHIIGPATGVAVGLAFVLPRAAWITLALLVILLVLARSRSERLLTGLFAPEPVTIALVLFCAWAALSTVWAIEPTDGALKALWLLLIVLFAHAGVRSVAALDGDALNAFSIGLVIALVLMGGLLAFEIWSGKALMRTLADIFPSLQRPGKHMHVQNGQVLFISDAEINRRTCVFTLLLVPGYVSARNLIGGLAGLATTVLLAVEAVLIAVGTEHQSSQLALLGGLLAILLYSFSPRLAAVTVASGWIIATLLVVPIVSLTYQIGLSHDERFPFSFRERVSIWGWQSGQVWQHPLLGAGANTTPLLDLEIKERESSAGGPEDRLSARYPGRHAHNFYLQVWFELGAVGAALFMTAGLSGFWLIRQLEAYQHFAVAQFAVTGVMIATSYGMWQIWLQAAIGLSWVIIAASASLEIDDALRQKASSKAPDL